MTTRMVKVLSLCDTTENCVAFSPSDGPALVCGKKTIEEQGICRIPCDRNSAIQECPIGFECMDFPDFETCSSQTDCNQTVSLCENPHGVPGGPGNTTCPEDCGPTEFCDPPIGACSEVSCGEDRLGQECFPDSGLFCSEVPGWAIFVWQGARPLPLVTGTTIV